MTTKFALACIAASVLILAPASATRAVAADGKTCRMEQQCKFVNFKKVCTWVQVCR